jgi:hypothetical protein
VRPALPCTRTERYVAVMALSSSAPTMRVDEGQQSSVEANSVGSYRYPNDVRFMSFDHHSVERLQEIGA